MVALTVRLALKNLLIVALMCCQGTDCTYDLVLVIKNKIIPPPPDGKDFRLVPYVFEL